jgi:hypothetical protein
LHIEGSGGWAHLVAEFVETESGKRADRPKLKAALAHAKALGNFAKLDRLSRRPATWACYERSWPVTWTWSSTICPGSLQGLWGASAIVVPEPTDGVQQPAFSEPAQPTSKPLEQPVATGISDGASATPDAAVMTRPTDGVQQPASHSTQPAPTSPGQPMVATGTPDGSSAEPGATGS